MPSQLPSARRLEVLEQVIKEGFQHFIAVGAALTEIRDSELYKNGFDSFRQYCRARWGISAAHAYRLCNSAQAAKNVASGGNEPVVRCRHALLLARLEPGQQRDAWKRAKSMVGPEGLTGEVVREAVNRVFQSSGAPTIVPPSQSMLNLNATEVGVLDAVVEQAMGASRKVSRTNPTLVSLRRKTMALKNKVKGR